MKTDQLIDMLSTNLEPIKNGGQVKKAFAHGKKGMGA